jgi:hypothetical protein
LLAAWTGGNNATAPYKQYSNPDPFTNNVIWHNRKFHFRIDPLTDPPTFGLVPDIGAGETPVYDDLEVIGRTTTWLAPGPTFSIMSETTNSTRFPNNSTNRYFNPQFVASYHNDNRMPYIVLPGVTTGIQTAVAFDEGGNFIDLRYGPLTPRDPGTGALYGDYHLATGSPAIDIGSNTPVNQCSTGSGSTCQRRYPLLGRDFDFQVRPNPASPAITDIGADEKY